MAIHNELGKKGELLAIDHLIQNGYTILETNWRYLKAEIDIIAQKENTLAIVEVKTRSTDFFGNPEEFVTSKKKQLLMNAANQYVSKNNINIDVSLDIIAIVWNKTTPPKIKHIKEAYLPF